MRTVRDLAANLEWHLSIILVVAIAILVNLQVFSRYVLHLSLSWTEETTRYMLVWLTFLGGAMGVRRGALVSIDYLVDKLPPRGRMAWRRVLMVAAAAFCLAVVVFGLQSVAKEMHLDVRSPATRTPVWVATLAVPIGCLLIACRLLQEAWRPEGGEA